MDLMVLVGFDQACLVNYENSPYLYFEVNIANPLCELENIYQEFSCNVL